MLLRSRKLHGLSSIDSLANTVVLLPNLKLRGTLPRLCGPKYAASNPTRFVHYTCRTSSLLTLPRGSIVVPYWDSLIGF